MQIITAEDLNNLLGNNDKPNLVDVRESNEFDYCHISGSINYPMSEIQEKWGSLDPNKEIIVICHHGARSMQVANFLENQGFKNIYNLEGGVDEWARTIDTSMPQY